MDKIEQHRLASERLKLEMKLREIDSKLKDKEMALETKGMEEREMEVKVTGCEPMDET